MHHAIVDEPEFEYIEGRAYQKVSPKRIHATVQANLLLILRRVSEARGIAATEWRFNLAPGTTLLPDVAYASYERLRTLTEAQADEPPFAPDIAGEVRSPSYRAKFAAEKIELYLRHGATLVFDVDPAKRMLHVHAANGEVASFKCGEAFVSDAIPWLQFEVDELFELLELPR